MLDEEEKMVLFSVALAGSWCSLGPFSWEELDWTGGHRHLMIEHLWSLPMCRFAVVGFKVLWVRHKSKRILLEFVEE